MQTSLQKFSMKDCQGISWQKITDATSAQEGLAKLKCLKKKKITWQISKALLGFD